MKDSVEIPRTFADYGITFDVEEDRKMVAKPLDGVVEVGKDKGKDLPNGITLIRRI